jgi:hypothetical protein
MAAVEYSGDVVDLLGPTGRRSGHVVRRSACPRLALIEKFELRADIVWQGAVAAFHHDRAQEQMALVDRPRADCVASEFGGSRTQPGPARRVQIPASTLCG